MLADVGEMWGWEDVEMGRCGEMWGWEDVEMCGWEDVGEMWDGKMWGRCGMGRYGGDVGMGTLMTK